MKTKNRSQIDLNKKLTLERKLFASVRSIFNDIAAKSSSPSFNPASYRDDIAIALEDQYQRVYSVFGDDYREIHGIVMSNAQESLMLEDIQKEFVYRAGKQSKIITKTNIKQLAKCKQIAKEQIDNSDLTYGQLVGNLYTAMLLRRIDVIAIYETQWCAEYSKAFEVSYLLGERGIEAKSYSVGQKRWDAVGDDRMRDWHAEVDSEVIEIHENFFVDDEEMRFPGDTSLGATAKNIANCRCSVSYEVDVKGFGHIGSEPTKKPFSPTPSALTNAQIALSKSTNVASAPAKIDYAVATAKDVTNTEKAVKKALNHAIDTGDKDLIKAASDLMNTFTDEKAAFKPGITPRKTFSGLGSKANKILAQTPMKTVVLAIDQNLDDLHPVAKVKAPPAAGVPLTVSSPIAYITNLPKVPTPGGGAVASYNDVWNTEKAVIKARKLAEASGIKENIDAAYQLSAEYANQKALFQPGVTPRKVFTSIGTKAKKIIEASNNNSISPISAFGKLPEETTYQKYTKLTDGTPTKPHMTARMKAKVDKIWEERYTQNDRMYGITHYELPVMTKDEISALKHFKSSSSAINSYQRNGALGYGRASDAQYDKIVDAIHSAIRKSEVTKEQTVYRGIADRAIAASLKKLKIGDHVSVPSTTSTSIKKEVASGSFSQGFVMEIRLPKGTKALYVDPAIKVNGATAPHGHEYEVILPKGGTLELIEQTETRSIFQYHAPQTFSAVGVNQQWLLIPNEFIVTTEDVARMSVNGQEYYAMLMLSGHVSLAQEFLDAATAE